MNLADVIKFIQKAKPEEIDHMVLAIKHRLSDCWDEEISEFDKHPTLPTHSNLAEQEKD